MDQETFESSRRSLLEKLQFHREQAQKITRALAGLDTAWQELAAPLNGERIPAPPREPTPEVSVDYDKSRPFKSLWSHKAIIVEVASRMRGNFGVNEVKAVIDQIPQYAKFSPLIQKSTISGRLKKMSACPSGLLEVVEHGAGTRPSIYRVKHPGKSHASKGGERDAKR